VPVIDDPDRVRLSPPVRKVLRRLARHRGTCVYVMSGRRLADLRQHVNIPGVNLLGLHGWESHGARLPTTQKHLLGEAKVWLAAHLPGLPRIMIEDKGYALAVHYRGAAAPAVRVAKQCMLAAHRLFGPELRLLKGKKIWELLPRAIVGKGLTTQGLLAKLPAHTLPIFIGDDTSDESAFAVIRHGLAIHVGDLKTTKATFTLRDPEEVMEFLERLEALLSRRQSNHRQPSNHHSNL